jgi:hypothetical protein
MEKGNKNTFGVGSVIVVAVLLIGGAYYFSSDTIDTSRGGGAPLGELGTGLPPVDPSSIGKVVKDTETDREFISNQIIVEFTSGTSEEEALGIIAENDGKMLQRFTAVPMFLIQVKDDGDGKGARATVDEFKKNPKVKTAELNFLTTLEDPVEE